jgi:hypothetical protein
MPDVLEGKPVGDDGPPAIGAKLDGLHGLNGNVHS